MRRGLALSLALIALLATATTWWLWPRQPQLDGTRPLPPVITAGRYLTVEGRRIEIRGVNYVRHSREDPVLCPELQFGADANCPYEQAAIEADMAQLQSFGVNAIRVFLNYYAFGGAKATNPSYNDEMALRHLEHLIDAANRHGIYVMPVLMAKYPQDRFGPEAYATALELHVRPVVSRLAHRPGLLAWDLFNEPDLGGPVDQRCWDWDNADFPLCFPLANERLRFLQVVHDEVKRLDPERLTTVSMGFAKNYFEPAEADLRLADVVDLLTFHYYDNDPYDSGRYAAHWYYGAGFPDDLRRSIAELHALGLEKPVLITEIGFPTGAGTLRAPEQLPRDLRQSLRVARDEQTAGIMLWPFQTDPDVLIGDLFR
jgi:hypothetical protein